MGNGGVAVLTVAAGLAGSVQVAVMGRFGDRIGVIEAVAFAAVVTAALAFVALLLVARSAGGYVQALHQPAWLWSGGLWGAIVVFTITLAAPRIGTFATVGLFLAGQLAMAVVIDRFGLFGLERFPLHTARVIGVALVALGAVLALRR